MTLDHATIRLPYGTSFVPIEVPTKNLLAVLERKEVAGLANEAESLRQAIRHPLASENLGKLLKIRDKVAVVVTDNTRACPDDRILPVILEELEALIPRRNIKIIVALGLHAPLSEDARIQKLGKKILKNYCVLNHDINHTVHIGITSRGNPVEIFQDVAEADFIMSTGFIEPHFFAGFSGGRKSIVPGVSSKKAILHNHSYPMVSHPRSRAGILQGNPIHEDLVEQARLAGLKFIVNVLLNSQGQITHVVAGDPVQAHEAGCELERGYASAGLSQLADITIISNGGAPLDLDLYQTCKAIDTAAKITRPEGIIIVASMCNCGVGPLAFCQIHAEANSPLDVIEKLKQEPICNMGWESQILARAQLQHSIFLLSTLQSDQVQPMMIQPIASIQDGILKALSILGKDAKIAVIPEGPRVLPFIKTQV